MSPPPDLELRALESSDLDSLIDLIERCDRTYLEWAPRGWSPPDLGWYRGRWEQRLGEPDVWTLGGFAGGATIAFVAFGPDRDRDGDVRAGFAHVYAVFVDPSRWREGIARELLALAEPVMRDRGFERASLWTPVDAPARLLYEALGWEAEGTRDHHEDLGLDVVRYEKALLPAHS